MIPRTLPPFLVLANGGTQESKMTGLIQSQRFFDLNVHSNYHYSLEYTDVWALAPEIPL